MNFIENVSVFLYSKKNLFYAVSIIFILRIIFLIFSHSDIHSVEDFTIAQNIVNGNGYSLVPQIGPTAIKTPVYPLILSLFILLFGTFAKIAIVIFQYFLASFIPLLLFKLSESLKLEKAGYIAAWLFMLHPSYFYYPNVIEVTNLFIPLILIFFIFSIKTYYSDNKNLIIIFGLISGIIILTQPIVSPIVLAVLIFLIIKKQWKKAILSFLLIGVVLAPWTVRNYNTFHKIIPTKSPFWMNFYVGFLPYNLASQKYSIINKNDRNFIDSLNQSGINDVDIEPYYKQVASKLITSNPAIYLEKTAYQMLSYWWVPPRYFNNNTLKFLIVRKIPVIIINILFIIGIITLFSRNKKLSITILAILLYFTLIYGLTQVSNIRFKLDIEWLELIPIGILFAKILTNKISKSR